MKWDLKRMLWTNSSTMITRKKHDEEQRRLAEETVRRINRRLEQYSKANTLEERKTVLKEWQEEAMTKGGTWFEEDED